MIFRPKIFISSTFKENEKIRKQIRNYFHSVGAEPLLYEHELTPSTQPMTYRTNLLDADFMILIIKNDYGNETELGISGIHEEYKIAHSNKIPLHVYLKNTNAKSDEKDNPLVKELKKDGISYYYFNSDTDLLNRLKETTFTIAKEIMLNDITNSKIPKDSIIKLAGDSDYNRAMEIISIIESMKDVVKKNELDWIYTDIFTVCLEPIHYEFVSAHHHFINWKLDECLNNMLKISATYMNQSTTDFTPNRNCKQYYINVLGKVDVYRLDSQNSISLKHYQDILDNFFTAYDDFKTVVQNMRTEIDMISSNL